MQLNVNKISKHYNLEWVFRNISFDLQTGQNIAILGKNGSGKSTLLQIVYGLVNSSEGNVTIDNNEIENHHTYFNFTSPSLLMPTEFSLTEIHDYQSKLGKMKYSKEEFVAKAKFTASQSAQPIQYFSSGMQQRLKTALCLYGEGRIKLLDEPLSNMDKDGEKWYLNCIDEIALGSIIIVASNYEAEYQFTNNTVCL